MLLVRALVLGYARRNALRAAVTLLAVALGVASLFAIDVANATAVASFSRSVDVIANAVNLEIIGGANGFDERVLLRVQGVAGVQSATPVIEGEAIVGARANDPLSGEAVRIVGIDITRAAIPAAASDAQGQQEFDLNRFINGRGIFISQRISQTYRAPAGALLPAFAGPQPVRFAVLGVIAAQTPGIDSSVAFTDIATAQDIFARAGRLDRIDLVVDPSRLPSVRRELARVIPGDTRVLEPKTRVDEIKRMLASFQMNLSALAYIALLVGMYLIYNTVAISVVSRRTEIGTLRALGAQRMQLFSVFLCEGAAYGVFGALLGLAFGAFLAQFSVAAVEQTVSTLYVGSHADTVVITPWLVGKAFAAGVILALLSAAVPALEAASSPPARAMRHAAVIERKRRGAMRIAAVAGIVLALLGAAALRAPAVDGDIPVFGYVAGVLLIAGASLLTPLVLAALAAVGARVAKRNAPAVIGVAFLRASPWRFSIAIASLAVAVAMTVSIAILVSSFRATISAWTAQTLSADLYIKPPGNVDASFSGRIGPATVAAIARAAGVSAVETYRGVDVYVAGRHVELGSTDAASFGNRSPLHFIAGEAPAAAGSALQHSDSVVVSEPFVSHSGFGAGDVVTIPTPQGDKPFRIVAVYNDYSTSGGTLIMDRARYRRLFDDATVDSVAVYTAPGVALQTVRTQIERAVAPLRIDISTNRELRAFALAVFDRTFAITSALYAISMTIAILGVVSTLFALVLERRVDIGLLRYIGLSTQGVRGSVLAQACAVGAGAVVVGLLLGAALAYDLIFVINRQSFGWLIAWQSPPVFFVQAAAAVMAAALIAALLPAARAASISAAEVLRVE